MKRKRNLRLWEIVAVFAMCICLIGCGNKENQPVSQEQEAAAENDTTVEQESTVVEKGESMESKKLQVEGNHLVDAKGQVVQLRGLSTHGITWFPEYVNQEWFQEFHDNWQGNVIRLAMYTAEENGYCSGGNQEDLKKVIDDGVKYATEAGLYVIIDWHILSDNDPNMHKEEAKKFFAEVSEKYKDQDNVLYEICNEPNGDTSWSDIKSYGEEIISVIRQNDKDAVIIVGTPNWSQRVDEAAKDPITMDDNVMYSLHFYAATHKWDLQHTMKKAMDAGLPIFVSEFGICDASGNGDIDEKEADKWVELMDEYQMSYVMWNISNKDESSAMLKKDCQKVNGFTEDDLNPSGTWLYHTLRKEK